MSWGQEMCPQIPRGGQAPWGMSTRESSFWQGVEVGFLRPCPGGPSHSELGAALRSSVRGGGNVLEPPSTAPSCHHHVRQDGGDRDLLPVAAQLEPLRAGYLRPHWQMQWGWEDGVWHAGRMAGFELGAASVHFLGDTFPGVYPSTPPFCSPSPRRALLLMGWGVPWRRGSVPLNCYPPLPTR